MAGGDVHRRGQSSRVKEFDSSASVATVETCASHIDARPVEDPLCHYVIARVDLPLGAAAAQIVHAAGESVAGPVPAGTFAVVLGVADEGALQALAARLVAAAVPHSIIVETDGNWAGQMMAIGVTPGPRSALRRHFSSLPLYGRVAQSRAPGEVSPEVGGSRPPSPTNSVRVDQDEGHAPQGVDGGSMPSPGTNLRL